MSRNQKLLWSLLTVVVMGSLSAFGTFSAFSHSTTNPGNSYEAGTVYIEDNDAGGAMYTKTLQKPGVATETCIKVSYGGTLPADVRLYMAETITPEVGKQTTLKIERGTATGTFPNCGTFTAASTVYTGNLWQFSQDHKAWATGRAAQSAVAPNEASFYRFTLTIADDATVNTANKGAQPGYTAGSAGYGSGTHSWTWEARNN